MTGKSKEKRINNRALIDRERATGALILESMPFDLTIEPGAICHLHCPFCEQTYGNFNLSREFLKYSDFKRILDYFDNSLQHLNLFNWGEPLLNKSITEMIEYASGHQIETVVHSNLNSLTEELAKKLIGSGLTKLVISIDGASEETYRIYRKKGSFQKAYNHLELLVRRKKESSNKSPIIIWKFIVFRHNQHEIKKAKEMAEELGIEINFAYAAAYGNYVSTLEEYNDVNSKEKYCREYGLHCDQLWNGPVIHSNGDILPCCLVYQKEHIAGNIFQQDFKSIWNNEKFQKLRAVAAGRKLSDPSLFCHNCRFHSE